MRPTGRGSAVAEPTLDGHASEGVVVSPKATDTPAAGAVDLSFLSAEARQLAQAHVPGEPVVAYAPFDIDDDLRFCRAHLLLTERELLILTPRGVQRHALADLEETLIEEGLGMDRLVLVRQGQAVAVARYSRRCRTSVNRLHRKLQRRLPRRPASDGGGEGARRDDPPAWLEAVERAAEAQDLCRKCGQLIPAYADGVCPSCLQQRKILLRLLGVAKPYRRSINLALVLTLLGAVVGALPIYAQKHLVDEALVATGLDTATRLGNLLLWGGVLVGVILLSEAIGGLRMSILARVGTLVARDLRHQVYAHLQSLSLRFFNKRRVGSLITRVTSDTERLWDFIVFGSVNVFRDAVLILAMGGIMFYMNWRLALVALTPVPIVGVLSYLRHRRMRLAWSRVWHYWSRVSGVVGDAIPGIRVIKAFANEKREVSRFDQRSNEYAEREIEANRLWWTLQPVVSGIMRFGGLMVLVVGGLLLIYKPETTTVGDLLAFSGAVWQFYGPVMELLNANRMVTRSATSAARVFEVLDTPPDVYARKDAYRPAHVLGRVEFRGVSFSYEGAQPALRDIDLVIEPGEMIGLCGPSGAGKSTFVNLICRFYDVTEGQILIDGVDVRDWDLAALRRAVGMVLQEPYLFQGTIADNIRYGKPDATPDEVIAAARAANAHNFIVGFPDGYDTLVGERGQSLSGGERQRISIARAILHNPRILILDEATSSVDSETEKQIQQALDRLVEGRTTIAIAHRLSTLTAANRLVVLDRGRIVETGTHSELANKENGVYARLVKTQQELGSMVALGK